MAEAPRYTDHAGHVQQATAVLLVDENGDAAVGGEAVVGQVGTPASLVDVTLTLDTLALASGDVASDTAEVAGAVRVAGGRSMLQSLILVDEDDQGIAIDLHFFSTNVSLGTKNSAPNISDANARNHLGVVSVAAADFKDLGGVRVATIRNIGLMLEAAASATSVYVSAIAQGSPTYTANGLKLRLGIVQG